MASEITGTTCHETGILVAFWDDPSGLGGLTTQVKTLGTLETNPREAVELHFDPRCAFHCDPPAFL